MAADDLKQLIGRLRDFTEGAVVNLHMEGETESMWSYMQGSLENFVTDKQRAFGKQLLDGMEAAMTDRLEKALAMGVGQGAAQSGEQGAGGKTPRDMVREFLNKVKENIRESSTGEVLRKGVELQRQLTTMLNGTEKDGSDGLAGLVARLKATGRVSAEAIKSLETEVEGMRDLLTLKKTDGTPVNLIRDIFKDDGYQAKVQKILEKTGIKAESLNQPLALSEGILEWTLRFGENCRTDTMRYEEGGNTSRIADHLSKIGEMRVSELEQVMMNRSVNTSKAAESLGVSREVME